MKKTKIVCTMGPNTDNREIMKELALNGMDVARFNFSHGDHAEHRHRLEILESVARGAGDSESHRFLDTKGTGNPYRQIKRWKESDAERGRCCIL